MSIWKWTKRGAILLIVAGATGFLFFGTDFPSYVSSAFGMAKESVRESVPIDLEIQRGRSLLERLGPELREDIRKLASDEVDVVRLEKDLERHRQAISEERTRLAALRDQVDPGKVSYTFGGRTFQREQVVAELDQCRRRLESAEEVATSKEKHLAARRAMLDANIARVQKKRHLKEELAAKIDALESEHERLKAQAEGSSVVIDESTLSQVKRLIGELEKRIEVTRKVLEHEAEFPSTISIEPPVDEASVLDKVDRYLGARSDSARL